MSTQPLQNLAFRNYEPDNLASIETIIRNGRSIGELRNYNDVEIERLIEGLGDEPKRTTIALVDGEIAGLHAMSFDVLYIVPAFRRQRIATRMVERLLATDSHLELSPERDNEGSVAFLKSVGFTFDHLMYQMKRPGDLDPGEVVVPDGYILRTYEHEDFDPYFALWNRAFLDHPTPLQVTEARVRAVHSRDSFDPTRIALIARAGNPNDLVGFITTRSLVEENGETIGPIGAVGTDRSVRRLGLGRTLLRWGIQRLKQDGAGPITLEVVTLNERALPLYESEGFVPTQSWEFWTHKG
ncbi:MAG: GNAT family N-acetyltransferase [Thermomicrobiales bacterium]